MPRCYAGRVTPAALLPPRSQAPRIAPKCAHTLVGVPGMANSFNSRSTLTVGGRTLAIHKLSAVEKTFPDAARLPFSLKVLLENLLRNENGLSVRAADVEALATWDPKAEPDREIAFTPARVLLQDFTGVPCVVDL